MFEGVYRKILAVLLSVAAFFGGSFSADKKEAPAPGGRVEEYSYGMNDIHTVDIAFPKTGGAGVRGLVLYVHGGAWISGDKSSLSDRLGAAASLGYVAASVNYRGISVSTHVKQQLDDITAALAKIKSVAAEKGFTVNRVMLYGFSAGAHLSLLYAYTRADEAPVEPVAVISCSGPTDLTADGYIDGNAMAGPDSVLLLFCGLTGVYLSMSDYRAKTGNYEKWLAALKKISPVNYVSSAVPTVIAQGSRDGTVPPANAALLDRLLTQAGIKHDYIVYPNSGHTLDRDPDCAVKVLLLTAQYAKAYL